MTWFSRCAFKLDCGLVEYGLIVANLQWESSVDHRKISMSIIIIIYEFRHEAPAVLKLHIMLL